MVQHQVREITFLQENQAILFGLVARLKAQMTPEVTEHQADRAKILLALLAANNCKMLAKDCRKRGTVDLSSDG
jgi:hypothetical protein